MDTVTRTQPSVQALLAVPLTHQDRCDSCSAQAYVRAVLPSGAELVFCGHHAAAQRPALIIAGAALHDETDRLTVKRDTAA